MSIIFLFISGYSVSSEKIKQTTGVILWEMSDLITSDSSVRIAGNPKLIEYKKGNAFEFNGLNDGIFLDNLPISGMNEFTIEAIFRPESGGNFEQRFFHCGEIRGERILLEIRSTATDWYFDAFVQSGAQKMTLIEPKLLHPLNRWYHVAYVVNHGKLCTYINGQKELDGAITFSPIQTGKTSIGVRLNEQSFLDAYRATVNEYYYQSAQKAANAIIWGQSHEGGWNYMIDFAGDRSMKQWYNTIGKNGWRLEEFQHYYGNSTFDDDITSDAARFLLRMYLEKLDPTYKPALEKAISFVLKSQYPNGGWPQRYPLKYDFNKEGHPDYTSFYTFNDDVIWENTHFLIQCYLSLGEERFLDPIRRGMEFYLISQDGCGAWGQQLNMNMETAGARTYEPAAFLPGATCENALLLLKFYQYTGDKKFLSHIPDAIKWLEETKLPADQVDGFSDHSTFVEVGTNKAIYVHRKGSNVKFGTYYVDYNDDHLLAHYGGKCSVQLNELKSEYKRLSALSPEEVTKDSPLKPEQFKGAGSPQTYYDLNRYNFPIKVNEKIAGEIVRSLDAQNRWLSKHASISHPYIGDGQKQEPTDEFASTNVGDETDTSPYRDPSDQEYISTGEYIKNIKMLINYIQSAKSPDGVNKSVIWH